MSFNSAFFTVLIYYMEAGLRRPHGLLMASLFIQRYLESASELGSHYKHFPRESLQMLTCIYQELWDPRRSRAVLVAVLVT